MFYKYGKPVTREEAGFKEEEEDDENFEGFVLTEEEERDFLKWQEESQYPGDVSDRLISVFFFFNVDALYRNTWESRKVLTQDTIVRVSSGEMFSEKKFQAKEKQKQTCYLYHHHHHHHS